MKVSAVVWRDALRHTSLLSAIPDELLAQIAEGALEKHFAHGEFVCHDGDYSNSLAFNLIYPHLLEIMGRAARAGQAQLSTPMPLQLRDPNATEAPDA